MKLLLNRAIAISLVILIIVPFSWSEENNPSIHLEESNWDFGFVPFDYDMVHLYEIENTGNDILHITNVISNCDCTRAIVIDTLIPPGSSTELRIDFWTTDYYGKNTRTIAVHSNDPKKPVLNVNYTADIGALPGQYRVAPTALFFLQAKESKQVRLTNKQKKDVQFRLEVVPDSVIIIDMLEGNIKAGGFVPITVSPNKILGKGTFFSGITVTFLGEKEVKTTIPIKIVKF